MQTETPQTFQHLQTEEKETDYTRDPSDSKTKNPRQSIICSLTITNLHFQIWGQMG